MNNQWILYASVATGVTFILFYVFAYSESISVQIQLHMHVGWMFRDGRVPEEGTTTLQGYALGWDFYEAQTCAARNLLGLQHWATSLDFGVVEPFVRGSFFRGGQFNNDKALRLSDYFDIDVWNHKVRTTIPYGTPLVKWEDFIRNAARQLIVVHTTISSREGTKVYSDVDGEIKKGGACFSRKGFYKINTGEIWF